MREEEQLIRLIYPNLTALSMVNLIAGIAERKSVSLLIKYLLSTDCSTKI